MKYLIKLTAWILCLPAIALIPAMAGIGLLDLADQLGLPDVIIWLAIGPILLNVILSLWGVMAAVDWVRES